MASHHLEQRRAHRRMSQLRREVQVEARFEATSCRPGSRFCTEVPATRTTRVTRPTDDWFTFLFPEDPDATLTTESLDTAFPTFSLPSSPPSSSSSSSFSRSSSRSSSSLARTPKASHLSRPTSVVGKTQTAAAAVNSASSSAAPTGGVSTGTVIGAVGGGVVGVAILTAIIAFFLRRYHRRRDEKEFDSADFRRSAVMLEDPPTHQDTVNAGFNPGPSPSMTEHRPATFGTLYGVPAPNYAQYQHGPITDNYNNIYADQPPSATSANPLFAPVQYSQNPFTPVSEKAPSPTTEWPITPQILTRTPSSGQTTPTLSRQSSGKTVRADVPVDVSRQSVPNDYVDLSRSSVTPFQAAQYVEISKTIGSEVPTGLSSPAVEAQLPAIDEQDLPPPPPKKDALVPSPFNDPVHANRFSASSNVSEADALEFPAPPAPTMMASSRYRIDSMPPMLPEIRLDRSSRSSFGTSSLGASPNRYDFPTSAVSSAFPSGISATAQIISVPPKSLGNTFPTTPSPLASSFGGASPSIEGSFETALNTTAGNPNTVISTPTANARPLTMYDPEDAYGGI